MGRNGLITDRVVAVRINELIENGTFSQLRQAAAGGDVIETRCRRG